MFCNQRYYMLETLYICFSEYLKVLYDVLFQQMSNVALEWVIVYYFLRFESKRPIGRVFWYCKFRTPPACKDLSFSISATSRAK